MSVPTDDAVITFISPLVSTGSLSDVPVIILREFQMNVIGVEFVRDGHNSVTKILIKRLFFRMVTIDRNNVVHGFKFAPLYEYELCKSVSDTAPERVRD